MLIGLAGSKRSGKDTAAAYLVRAHGFEQDSFAAPMRRFACDLLCLTPEELDARKEEPFPILGGKSARFFLQRLGSEFVREQFDPETWIKAAMLRTRGKSNVVLSDVRFGNEAIAIVQRGGFIIRLRRDTGLAADGHASEAKLPAALCDYEIDNNGTFEDLFAEIDHILALRRARAA